MENGLAAEVSAQAINQLHSDGYCVIEDAISPDLVAELRAALDEIETEQGLKYASTSFEGYQTLRIYNLLARHPAFERIPTHKNTLPIAESILGEGLLLSSLSAIILGSGQAAQPIHSDTQMISLPRPHPPIALNCMWALSDFTEENGATRIVPGSHKNDHAPDYDGEHESIPAEMPAGSVMFFDGSVWHGGGANRTDERRYGVANYYCAGWVRAQENQQLGISQAKLKSFPRELQELCGYSVYQGIYGHVDNRDPIELLGRESHSMMVWEASDKARR